MLAGLDRTLAGPVANQLLEFARTRRLLIEVAALGAGVALFLASVLPNLANHPAITDDEMWVFSAAYKLSEEGVFGSDMFEGFFNADRHYFFNMPAHHFAVAGSFKLFGVGVVQARLVGVVYGVATLLLTYLLARRVFGVATAMLSLALLLFLRLNMGFDTGLPLQELAANMRYDLAPVPFMLGGFLVLLGGPSLWRAAAAGALFGVATLMQFYGAFAFPIALAFLWLERISVRDRLRLVGGMLGVAALVGLPYGVYILANYDDFQGQARTIDGRGDFADPGFYPESFVEERHRFIPPLAIPPWFYETPPGQDIFEVEPQKVPFFDALPRRPSAKLGVLAGLPFALVYVGQRWLRGRSRGDLLLLLCLAGLPLEYALFERAKFYIYWVPVVPFLSIGIAAGLLALLQPARWDRPRIAAAGVAVAVLLLVFAEGGVARIGGMRTAYDASDYAALGEELRRYVPEGARVVGSTSLWWGLHDTEFRSYFLFYYHTRRDAAPYKMTIREFLEGFDPQYIVLTRLASSLLEKRLIPSDYRDFRAYLDAHTESTARIEGPVAGNGYGYVDVWKLR